jgi:hypothetical protein
MTPSEPSESFQIPLEAAEAYEAVFVPAFFAQWAPILCDTAAVGVGQEVLDVACGLALSVAPRPSVSDRPMLSAWTSTRRCSP